MDLGHEPGRVLPAERHLLRLRHGDRGRLEDGRRPEEDDGEPTSWPFEHRGPPTSRPWPRARTTTPCSPARQAGGGWQKTYANDKAGYDALNNKPTSCSTRSRAWRGGGVVALARLRTEEAETARAQDERGQLRVSHGSPRPPASAAPSKTRSPPCARRAGRRRRRGEAGKGRFRALMALAPGTSRPSGGVADQPHGRRALFCSSPPPRACVSDISCGDWAAARRYGPGSTATTVR